MLDPQILVYGIYFLVVTAVILAVEAAYVTVQARQSHKSRINHRLGRQRGEVNPEKVLADLRKERGLTESGDYRFSFVALNRLYLQSGMTGSPIAYFGSFAGLGVFLGAAAFYFTNALALAVLTFALVAATLPVLLLIRARARRKRRFAEQLPDALDIIVRSLKAGHPTPVSLSLVAREMPDPIGSEFGIVTDEMTYGLELDRAMRNLLERVGLDDLRLIVVSMGIQASTGGNLAEILGNLSNVIRDRFKLRRKIRAISAEGRWSGIIISVFPFLLFGVINLIAPTYYGEIWNNPLVVPVLGAAVFWMLVGDAIMYRMVKFDF